ncbi:FkbM family methyltransferase [Brevundimonas sp.]
MSLISKRLARLFRPLTRILRGHGPIGFHHAAVRRRPVGGREYVYVEPGVAIARLNAGPALYVDPVDDQICADIILRGAWEYWVSAVVLALLKPGARVVEVGANVGYYTLIMANRVGRTGHVTALEANPRLVGLINRSIQVNAFGPRVRVVAKAALDGPGSADFVSFRRNSGSGHITATPDGWFDPTMGEPEHYRVETVRLDDLDCGKVDLIRLDAEGSEPFILKGAAGLLQANPDIVVCMEWSVIQMGSRTSVPDFVRWLSSLGFRFWRIGPPTGLTPLTEADLLTLEHCDVVVSRRTPVLSR